MERMKIASASNKIAAEMLGNLRDEYMASRFTRKEAIDLCKVMINNHAQIKNEKTDDFRKDC